MKKKGEKKRYTFRRSSFLPVLLISVSVVLVLSVAGVFAYRKINYRVHNAPSITKLVSQWSEYDYAGVYETASTLLEKKILNNTVHTYRGYAAYYLGVSETDSTLAQEYINDSISSLRIALLTAKERTVPQITYMLGKAYFYKNIICSYHYYADLAVKYLEKAKELGYKADDIPEYLGISYGQLGMSFESIARFSEALLIRESDSLLLSIAEQYYKAGQFSASKQYLFQVTSQAQDDNLLLKAQTLLAKIYLDEENYDEAKKLFDLILEKNENSADAHYGLGVVYEKKGDLVRARSEWRKTLKIDSMYEDAVKKIYK